MKNPVLIMFALVIVASLFAGAWIVVAAPGWRVLYVVWPLAFSAFGLIGLGNRASAERPVIGRRREED